MKRILSTAALCLLGTALHAKLPAPSDEAKAKAAEAAAKTAHGTKVADFQLCKSREKVADQYRAQLKKSGKDAGAVVDTPACADPGAFVYVPPAAASAPAAATAAASAAPAPAKKG
ncbi:hypothetical protein [Ideonella sp.]|uniref:hypothetical protein n=1 Tax=Ideonella sp. TaxID=1929293 RepID=UPI003BB5AD71